MHAHPQRTRRPRNRIEVRLDGRPILLPAQVKTLAAIRSRLEALALKQRRCLWSLRLDGKPTSLTGAMKHEAAFVRVEGETLDWEQISLWVVEAALRQTAAVRAKVLVAVALVMINDMRHGAAHWRSLAQELKQPLLTLNIMPERAYCQPKGSASLAQLRQWRLEQLDQIITDAEETCLAEDPTALSHALEHRVLPWLDSLQSSLELWRETLLLAPGRAGQA